ncbi:MAG: SBBP repeat-containing protein, partial [Chthoniobacterales bacterium]
TAAGGAQMRQGKPLIYQELNGTKRAVSGGFTATGNHAGFTVGNYDRSRPLLIDPPIITYSTYLAGEEDDRVHDIKADADSNAYVTGWTQSDQFPTKNAYQPGNNSFTDEAFITKFNPDGTQLIWSTYLGGGFSLNENGGDGAYGIALDEDRNVYVTGWTFSFDFPTRNAMQTHLADSCCNSDSFITKLNAAGNQLIFSTYFGGVAGDDVGRGIAVDSSNNIYVTGYTRSFAFPTTNPIQKEINGRTTHMNDGRGIFDAYLAKIDASGQFRVYSTYVGGDQTDVATGVAVDKNGAAYITGWTESTFLDPSATPEPNRIQEFNIPQPFGRAGFITVGPDSQIWFGDIESTVPGRMGRLNIQPNPTATPTFDIFEFGDPDNAENFPGCQTVGDLTTRIPLPTATPDNHVYFNDYCTHRIGRMDTAGNADQVTGLLPGCAGQITNNPDGHVYTSDSCNARVVRDDGTAIDTACGGAYGLVTGPNGHLYVLDGCGYIDEVALNSGGGTLVNFFGVGTGFGHFATLTAGPDGNLYFTTDNDVQPVIGRFNPTTGQTTLLNNHSGFGAQGITAGPDGNIYFVVSANNSIGRLELGTGTVRQFGLPSCNAEPRDIVAGPDGNLYFTEANTDKIGRYKLNPLTPQPPATPTPCPIVHVLFPTTTGAFQTMPSGTGFSRDAFITKVDPAGSQYLYSTFLGGQGEDTAWGIAVGADRSAFVTGYTNSGATPAPASFAAEGPVPSTPSPSAFPTTTNAYQQKNAGGYDAFLTRLSPDGSGLIYSTYIGGERDEGEGLQPQRISQLDGAAVAVDLTGNAYITGWTESTFVAPPASSPTPTPPSGRPNGASSPTPTPPPGPPVNFPTTADAYQPQPGSIPFSFGNQARDAFISIFNTNPAAPDPQASLVYSSFLGGTRQDEGEAIALDPSNSLFVGGFTRSDGGECENGSTEPCQASEDLPNPNSTNDFPTTAGAFQEEPSVGDDGWVAGFVFGSTGGGGSGSGFMIFGQITFADDGTPVQGVTVTLTKPDATTMTTTTDAMGNYSFPNLPPVPESPYTVTPSGLGFVYNPASRQVIITNKNERADFLASFPEPSPTPTATATATPTPSSTVTSQADNLSTRLHVLTGDQVGIGGFIVTGSGPKHVILRAIGPSLTRFGIPNPLPDPVLELHGPGSFATLSNDNWRDTQEEQIKASGIPPTDDREAAIDITLAPGQYTGIIRGNGGSTGIGLIEVYDLDQAAPSKLSNISTRGFVGSTPGDSVIAGFILGNSNVPVRIVIRGLGPSLTNFGVPNVLQNPTLELHNADGALLFTNNDWKDNSANAAEVSAAGLAPGNDFESAIAVTLPPGVYTAILAGLDNSTGNALVEVYDRGAGP